MAQTKKTTLTGVGYAEQWSLLLGYTKMDRIMSWSLVVDNQDLELVIRDFDSAWLQATYKASAKNCKKSWKRFGLFWQRSVREPAPIFRHHLQCTIRKISEVRQKSNFQAIRQFFADSWIGQEQRVTIEASRQSPHIRANYHQKLLMEFEFVSVCSFRSVQMQ